MPGGSGDQPGADTAAPHPRGHDSIEDEGMGSAVPRHVDKSHQLTAPPGAHPAKTVLLHPGTPVKVTTAAETLCMQGADSRAVEIAAPVIRDRHPAIVPHAIRGKPVPGVDHNATQQVQPPQNQPDHDLLLEYRASRTLTDTPGGH
jgi:hypothetical protein